MNKRSSERKAERFPLTAKTVEIISVYGKHLWSFAQTITNQHIHDAMRRTVVKRHRNILLCTNIERSSRSSAE
ncbi:unnamed protein product [Caenorhabditis angaria]|uniref:Uncharacterized protein n=1 Tax=Caenorhabditis angaria TaxID=860376 RepID=A0A9P1MVJ9_9PELO|nr:unnamed protein product [Caenorhabditis angaria]